MTIRSAKLLACCWLAWAASGCKSQNPSTLDTTLPATGQTSGTSAPATGATAGTSASAAGSAALTAGKSAGVAGAGTAGTLANAGTSAAPSAGSGGQAATNGKLDHHTDIRGNCKIDSGYDDDHACIPAPDPAEGFQIHIGPSDYKDPAQIAKFVQHPGKETSECFAFKIPNDRKVYYQTSMLSGRKGTHHIISSMYDKPIEVTGGFGACADPTSATGSLPGASKPFMPRGTVAPEYAHVGKSIPVGAYGQFDMHYYNFTDKDILREVWVNIYYADEKEITQESKQLVGFGGVAWSENDPIKPGTDMVYKYACPVTGEGKLLSLLGHYHAHGKRFTASIQRKSGAIERVFEMYDYNEPATFEYNSIAKNPMFADGSPGAVSGQLALHDGDQILWECHIINDSNVGLTYTNFVKTGEMCNLWGDTIGVDQVLCFLP